MNPSFTTQSRESLAIGAQRDAVEPNLELNDGLLIGRRHAQTRADRYIAPLRFGPNLISGTINATPCDAVFAKFTVIGELHRFADNDRTKIAIKRVGERKQKAVHGDITFGFCGTVFLR